MKQEKLKHAGYDEILNFAYDQPLMTVKATCKKCVSIDSVFQSCIDDLVDAWDNIGYHMDAGAIFCPSCGKRLTEVEV